MKSEITGHTRLAALFAKPARHSISPVMHNLSFAHHDIDAIYLAFDVEPENLKDSIQSIRSFDMLGVNLSMPHKMAVIPYLDELSSAAELIGAVNTIVNKEGKLIGYNTDGIGFMRGLKDIAVEIKNKRITVIGAGGAATAIICQAALDGVSHIDVFNRKDEFYGKIQEKLAYIAEKTGCRITLQELTKESELVDSVKNSALLVNATGVGMSPNESQSPIEDFSILRSDLAVYDVIYNPRQTLLLKKAQESGAKTANGLSMLIHQGAAAFELWTEKHMPLEIIKPIVEKL